MEIGNRIRELRQERGLSQRELGRRAGLSHGAISHLELGIRTPGATTLVKLADALGVEMGDFFPKAQAELPFGPARRPAPGETVNISAFGSGEGEGFAAPTVTVEVSKLRAVLAQVARGQLAPDDALEQLRAA